MIVESTIQYNGSEFVENFGIGSCFDICKFEYNKFIQIV